MADLYGEAAYGAGAYSLVLELAGYGSGLYGADLYGGGTPAPSGGNSLFGRRAQPERKTQPRKITHETDDEEVALIMVALL